MIYKFTDEGWANAKNTLTISMMHLNHPEPIEYTTDDYANAGDAIDNAFIVDEYFGGEENAIDERSIERIARSLVESFGNVESHRQYVWTILDVVKLIKDALQANAIPYQDTLTPLKFQDLKEGDIYNVFSTQFQVSNQVKLISFDTTGLNRKIAYFGFSNRPGITPPTKKQLVDMFQNDRYPFNVFALWDHDLLTNIVTK